MDGSRKLRVRALHAKKISDDEFRNITARYHRANDKRQRLYNKDIKTLFYRKDSNMLLPVTNGRVGGLAQRVKKRKQKKREDRLKRTKYCPQLIDEKETDGMTDSMPNLTNHLLHIRAGHGQRCDRFLP